MTFVASHDGLLQCPRKIGCLVDAFTICSFSQKVQMILQSLMVDQIVITEKSSQAKDVCALFDNKEPCALTFVNSALDSRCQDG